VSTLADWVGASVAGLMLLVDGIVVGMRNLRLGRRVPTMDRTVLGGCAILVVEEQPLIALELQTALEDAGAEVLIAHDGAEAKARIGQFDFAAAVLDLRPASNEQRDVARLLRRKGIRFLFYATHPPEDVTTTRGAPVFLKPTPPQEVVRALAVLIEEEKEAQPPRGLQPHFERKTLTVISSRSSLGLWPATVKPIPVLPKLEQCEDRNSRTERPMPEAKMVLMEVIEDEGRSG
jgi:CheY-like chemotaxis protein